MVAAVMAKQSLQNELEVKKNLKLCARSNFCLRFLRIHRQFKPWMIQFGTPSDWEFNGTKLLSFFDGVDLNDFSLPEK